MSQDPPLFKITDICLASIIRTRDFELKNWRIINYQNNRSSQPIKKIEFYFQDIPEIRDIVKEFYTSDCFPYKKFFQCLKELKGLMFLNGK
jgi:hypothetical protein